MDKMHFERLQMRTERAVKISQHSVLLRQVTIAGLGIKIE